MDHQLCHLKNRANGYPVNNMNIEYSLCEIHCECLVNWRNRFEIQSFEEIWKIPLQKLQTCRLPGSLTKNLVNLAVVMCSFIAELILVKICQNFDRERICMKQREIKCSICRPVSHFGCCVGRKKR